VLGVEAVGATYYWNEFNLESPGGTYATLVFEEGSSGGNWRLFEMFDPQTPMSAEEAAGKREGDAVNLDGTTVHVTRVDRSRVYAVAGKVPEGEAVGQHAHYFNAEAGDKMIVVSWTGNEVEFYTGQTITRGAVASAFNLSGWARFGFALTGGRSFLTARVLTPFLLVGVMGALLGVFWRVSRVPARPPAVVVFQASPSPLAIGEEGVLDGHRYRIGSHALVDVGEVGLRFGRHEYELNDDNGNNFLLISGSSSNASHWILCAPIDPSEPLTPRGAGGVSAGQIIKLYGEPARITKLFRSTIREVDGSPSQNYTTGDILYGFSGPMRSNILMVRWNASNIVWFKGTFMGDAQVRAAFPRRADARQ
jgi:hypothetical protein